MEWNWNLSIGFRQAVSETISVGAGLFTSVGSTVEHAGRGADDCAGQGLNLADLVHAIKAIRVS